MARAEALAFIAPVHFLSFPAILKGWLDRVWTPGFAYDLTPEAWRGDIDGRRVIDEFTLTYSGIKKVEHEYFYAVHGADDATRQGYLERAYAVGRQF